MKIVVTGPEEHARKPLGEVLAAMPDAGAIFVVNRDRRSAADVLAMFNERFAPEVVDILLGTQRATLWSIEGRATPETPSDRSDWILSLEVQLEKGDTVVVVDEPRDTVLGEVSAVEGDKVTVRWTTEDAPSEGQVFAPDDLTRVLAITRAWDVLQSQKKGTIEQVYRAMGGNPEDGRIE